MLRASLIDVVLLRSKRGRMNIGLFNEVNPMILALLKLALFILCKPVSGSLKSSMF